MIDGSLFNVLTATRPPTGGEILAGPYGLLWFVLLIIPLRYAARAAPRAAVLCASLLWLVGTLYFASIDFRPRLPRADWRHFETAAWTLAGLSAAVVWLMSLAALRRRGVLGKRTMIGLVWGGLHVPFLVLWLGWYDLHYPSRLAVLHNLGLAYLMLRLIAWGVALAENPRPTAGLVDTACWLLYPPCMRLGPVMLREIFVKRLREWSPQRSVAWREVGRRLGLFVLGGAGLALTQRLLPRVVAGSADYFTAPQSYSTAQLLAVFYVIPIHVYLLLWTYNELAAGLAAWVGVRVDDNFDWLPRATSIRDFWRRWHVTLGAWLREFMYIPLGGNRRHVALNYAIVFGYCGLWHGPSWSFLAWGLLQAAALIVQRRWDQLRRRLGWAEAGGLHPRAVLGWLITVHFAAATIVVFCDFRHLAGPLFLELLRRCAS